MNLMQGDCLERMKEIENGSVDLTVTSPPYDNLRSYKGSLEWGEQIWKPIINTIKIMTSRNECNLNSIRHSRCRIFHLRNCSKHNKKTKTPNKGSLEMKNFGVSWTLTLGTISLLYRNKSCLILSIL